VENPAHQFHHSAAFSWDGDKLVITDEALSGTANCAEQTPIGGPGSVSIYDVSNVRGDDADRPRARLLGTQAPPRTVAAVICSSKQVSVIPLPDGRDVMSISWLGGGTSLVDFTKVDVATGRSSIELAHFTVSPGTPDASFAWAAYWYNGYIYVNNVFGCASWPACVGSRTRGLDVLEVGDDVPDVDGQPLAPRLALAPKLPRFNFALQECLPSVAPCRD
jgi:hypothetical protein